MAIGTTSSQESSFLSIAQQTGITITQEGNVKIWEGPVSGKMKPKGPLAGKTVGVLVASEFSDFQAYYLASYASEFGGKVVFLLVDWVKWKFSRPNVSTKGVRGMWGMSVDPIPVLAARHTAKPLDEADPQDYDALVIPGGHSGDIMMPEAKVIQFIKAVYDQGTVVGAIGGGSIPLISAGIMHGKKATGNSVVSFMLKKIGTFKDTPVERDGQVITARDTVDTQAGTEGLQYAASKGLAVAIMEPLLGGRLATPPPAVQAISGGAPVKGTPVEWALRWLWDQPEVSVVLSGMSTMEQVEQNVTSAPASSVGSFTAEEQALIAPVRETYRGFRAIPCTQCRYCMPCPNEGDIPSNFHFYNHGMMYDDLRMCRLAYSQTSLRFGQAEKYTQCGECEPNCPQLIAISEWMPRVHAVLGEGQPYPGTGP